MEKKFELEEIPGVGKKIAEKLREVGFSDPMAIAVASPSELATIAEIGEGQAAKIINAVRQMLEIGYETADKVLERKKKALRITTGSKNLDNLLGGGIETQAITESYAAFGGGKTQLGFQLAVNVQLTPEKGGLGRGCLFIDTENTFSPQRIVQMAEAKKLDPNQILKNIYVARAYNSEHQIFLIEKAPEIMEEKKIGLIVVDSLTSHFRADFVGRAELAERQQKLNRHLHQLQKLADAYNLAVYVTNQVMARPDVLFGDATAPVGGHVLAHMCLDPDSFVITNDGIERICKIHNPACVYGFKDGFNYFRVIERAEVNRKNLVEINHTLKLSKDHRVFIFTQEGFKEVLAGELKKGDYLILPKEIKLEEEKFELKVKEIQKHEVKMVSELNEDLAQLLGYYFGNGSKSFHNDILQIKEKRLEVLQKYAKIFSDLFNVKLRIKKVKGKNCFEIRVSNKYLSKLFQYMIKNVYKIFKERQAIIKAFLRGLFDADGSLFNSRVELTMEKDFLVFVKLLLLRLGLGSKISKRGSYRILVNPREFLQIGFTTLDKNLKFKFNQKKWEMKIPLLRRKVCEVLSTVGIKVDFKHLENNISYSEFEKLYKQYEDVKKIFGPILELRFEKVTSISNCSCSRSLIDIETNSANFFANGYLVHNSTYRLYLRKGREGMRIARLVDAPNLPEAEAIFKITKDGIVDP